MKTIRERLLSTSARSLSRRIITLKNLPTGDDGSVEDIAVLVKTPTVGQRNAMFGEIDAGGVQKFGADKLSKMQLQSVIQCCLDPTTEKPIFEATDEALLLALPANGWFDTLSQAVNELAAEAQAAAKN